MLKINLLQYLNYGAIGVGAGLAGLSYNLLMKVQESAKPSEGMLNLIRIFMIFSVLIVLLAFFKETYDRIIRRKAINEVDPADPGIWGKDGNFEFRWYNAPYGLAINELGEMNMEKIKKKNVNYKFLLFEGHNKSEKDIYRKRYELLKAFLKFMKSKDTPLEGNVEVRVKKEVPIPEITFYNLKKDKRHTAIFYLGPCIEQDGKAWKAFQTQNEAVYHRLNHEFQDKWATSTELKLDQLLA